MIDLDSGILICVGTGARSQFDGNEWIDYLTKFYQWEIENESNFKLSETKLYKEGLEQLKSGNNIYYGYVYNDTNDPIDQILFATDLNKIPNIKVLSDVEF